MGFSTTFNYPYNIARQFKALDVISHGRAGWNAVTTSNQAAAANFGAQVASRKERYDMAHESIQIVQALWGSWEEEALERRRQLMRFNPDEIPSRVSYLGSMVGLHLSVNSIDIDQPLAADLLERAYPSPQDPHSDIALKLLKKELSVRDVLAHGVINYHPVVAGTVVQVADFLEEWFLADACDGFSIVPDIAYDGVADFVEQVVPILQERGLFHKEYEGKTLRENMGVPYQYGSAEIK